MAGPRRSLGWRTGLACLACLAWTSSCVDTTPGLEVTATSGRVTVAADGALSVDLDLRVHVGRYALAGRSFVVPRVDLFAGGEGLAQVNLDRPADFVGELGVGESRDLTLHGAAPAMAWPRVAELCGAEVTLLAQWQAETAPADPAEAATMEFGSVSVVTMDVLCE